MSEKWHTEILSNVHKVLKLYIYSICGVGDLIVAELNFTDTSTRISAKDILWTVHYQPPKCRAKSRREPFDT